MHDKSLDMIPPDRLALLLDTDAVTHWSKKDAAAALRHQLAAPLLPDLAQCPGASPEHLAAQVQAHEGRTFQSHLRAAVPSKDTLEAIKAWARHLRQDPAMPAVSPLTPGPATVLYYGAIAAALVRLNQRITTLTDTQLREGFAWSLQQQGAEALRELFEAALARLGDTGT